MKIAVIGAGPAGLTAAYQLSKAKNIQVDVYEASSSVGGMAKTIELWDQKVDLGPHRFFSSDTRVNKLWLELANGDYDIINRLTRIYYKNKFFHYPLRAFDALQKLGFSESFYCLLSYLKQRVQPQKNSAQEGSSFEDWVVSRFGTRLFDIFFKTYSEKLWGIPCTELDADFAAQRIKKLSLMEALKNALLGGYGNKHKTLISQFAYPHGGTGVIYERMASFIEKWGGRVILHTPVHRVVTENGVSIGIETLDTTGEAEFHAYDYVISSMPISLMVSRLQNVPFEVEQAARSLTYRNTILVYIKIDAVDLFPDNWLYVHSNDLKTGRITNFRNWLPQLYGNEKTTILALEYWCYNEDEAWNLEDKDLISLASGEIKKTGLIGDAEILAGHVVKLPRCYPVYGKGYKKHLKPIENYLSTIKNLLVIGRYGAFKYNNQDHSILMGMLAAEKILDSKAHNLWEINTDYNYQESSVITKTGLVHTG